MVCDFRSNEKEISHGRALWQARGCSFLSGAVGFIDWLDLRSRPQKVIVAAARRLGWKAAAEITET